MASGHRDRTYIRKDIILRLAEYGELTQTKLLSYCGLNLAKHKEILEDMEKKGLLTRSEEKWGGKTMTKYKVNDEGMQFCQLILEPYEKMFPRSKSSEEEQS